MNRDGMQVTEQDSTSEWKHRGDYERRGRGATLGWDVTVGRPGVQLSILGPCDLRLVSPPPYISYR